MPNHPFKLIAIKPLKDCTIKHLKILQEDTPYYLYNNYTIDGDAVNIDELTINKDFPPEIYDIGDIKINISAVVGTNGAGKSSLVELLYVAMYNLSFSLGLLEESKKEFKILKYERDVAVAIYYDLGGKYYRLTIIGRQIRLAAFDSDLMIIGTGEKINHKTQLNELFYSVIVNYSQYALNSSDNSYWLNAIFHKNDGYQTPVVINPYRNRGNIDINTENFLVRSRLLANIMEGTAESLWFNNNAKVPSQLTFKFIEHKFKPNAKEKARRRIIENWKYRWTNLLPLLREIFGEFDRDIDTLNIDQYAKRYLLLKMESMSRKYTSYNDFQQFFKDEHSKLVQPFLKKINADTSHKAFKFKQALNFLRFDTLPAAFWKLNFNSLVALNELPIKDLREKIEDIQLKHPHIPTIELIPPAFLQTDILFENEQSRFSKLSSGEKQKIYALASLVYHLKNLSSVEPDEADPVEKRLIKYRNINIIFDEVELYYHPDLQRRFVKDMIENIRIANFKGIDAINFLFITHSPFILSDIPNENILYLDVKEHRTEIRQIDQLTFGGNIHDLLASSFFLQHDGFMGEFARGVILKIFDYLQAVIKSQGSIQPVDVVSGWNAKKAFAVISRIGERLVQDSLLELYFAAFPTNQNNLNDEQIDAEIERLQQLKKGRNTRS